MGGERFEQAEISKDTLYKNYKKRRYGKALNETWIGDGTLLLLLAFIFLENHVVLVDNTSVWILLIVMISDTRA